MDEPATTRAGGDAGPYVIWAGVLLVAACGRGHPLSEVPIRGGTAAQQDEVRAALVEFDEAVGPGRVEVRSVHISAYGDRGNAGWEFSGEYHHATRRLDLNEAQEVFRDTVWHELCHALDGDEGVTDADPFIDRLAAGLFDPAYPRSPLHADKSYQNERLWPSETLATFCGIGPYPAALLARGEPDDAGTDLGAWFSEHVWREFVLEEQEPDAASTVTWDVGQSTVGPLFRPTEDASVVEVEAGFGSERRVWAVDLYSGAVVDGAAPTVPSSVAVDVRALSLVVVIPEPDRVGWTGSGGATFGAWDLRHLGSTGIRLMVTDGDGPWRWVPGIVETDRSHVLFTADDQVWLGWSEGRTLQWAPLASR